MLNIDDELKKIKQLLEKTITLGVEIVPNYDFGNKISIRCYKMIDNKMTKYEYSFSLRYFKDKDNYANAPYLLDCDYSYNLGGGGYADKYESIEDFKNTKLYLELLKDYGKNKQVEEVEEIDDDIEIADEIEDTPTLFDDTEELTLFDLDNEDINVSSEDNQLSLFDEVDPVDNNVDLEDLLSYGVDDYYKKEFAGKCTILSEIQNKLSKLPKYKEYYNKLKTYLENKLPVRDINEVDFREDRYVFMCDDVITVKENRCQSPIYCYKMYENMLKN